MSSNCDEIRQLQSREADQRQRYSTAGQYVKSTENGEFRQNQHPGTDRQNTADECDKVHDMKLQPELGVNPLHVSSSKDCQL